VSANNTGPYRFVRVEWIDSVERHQWLTVPEAVKDATVDGLRQESIGYLIAENETALTLARDRSAWDPVEAEAKVGGIITIPKVAALSVSDLSDALKAKPKAKVVRKRRPVARRRVRRTYRRVR
jgi:hypothetical protein